MIEEGYVLACSLNDLPKRGKRLIHINDLSVLIITTDTGVYAVEDACPHTARSIAHGQVLGRSLTTPTNGARYDLETGKYLGGGQSPFQSHWLTVFRVHVVGDQVYIQLPSEK
jgi:nitrite reductase (NADH) small subunit